MIKQIIYYILLVIVLAVDILFRFVDFVKQQKKRVVKYLSKTKS